MVNTYTNPAYPFRRPPELDRGANGHHRVAIVGAGPSGLSAALELARQGIASVVLDDNNTVSVGSRAICFAKRTLEIMDRLGAAQPMLDKGVTWQRGRVFFRSREVYNFDLLPEPGHRMPAFINLQQYYFEEYLIRRIAEFEDLIELRWQNEVTALQRRDDGVALTVTTPEGEYRLDCDYLLVADGANSGIREKLGLDCRGQVFKDRFLIADVVMKVDFPAERWFWFDPPFHPNQSVLLHKQPDNVWRIDFQLGADADRQEELKEANIRRRVQAMLGPDVDFELEWSSIYTFRCRKMERFCHGRVIFMGDAAHQVSPFGARGANGGVQAVENLCWKLGRVLQDRAPEALLQTYDTERIHGADENILNSTRATDFITPRTPGIRLFRDAVLELAEHYPFARSLVNSGRLSRPCRYPDSPLNTPDRDAFDGGLVPGSPPLDAPVARAGADGWLLHSLGDSFVLLLDGRVDEPAGEDLAAVIDTLRQDPGPDLHIVLLGPLPQALRRLPDCREITDPQGLVPSRYDLRPGSAYLFRPDQHVAGRWRTLEAGAVREAMTRALGWQLQAAEARYGTA